MPETLDSLPPSFGGRPRESHTPIVAIGAAAGGVEALRRFFQAAPHDGGVAYVVILHPDAAPEGRVAETLSPATSLSMHEVAGDVAIEPNHVYVVSPRSQLEIEGDLLRALPLPPRMSRLTADHLFRSLAEARHGDAVGVVLSGEGRDGALGLRAIREREGITATQDPEDAEYPEMPRSAREAGQADLVLAAQDLPAQLLRVLSAKDVVPAEAVEAESVPEDPDRVVERIISRLEEDIGHSFHGYKRPTVLRRLHRRMRFHRSRTLTEYARRIEADRRERRELFQDLLISVSRFFRDPVAFEALEREVIPLLFERKSREDQVRIWVPGCATGEEAYSLSMLIRERAEEIPAPPEIRIFASDIDERALAFARRGHYPDSVAEDIPADRLERYFMEVPSGYRAAAPLRDPILFAAQGVLTDPPFPRLDLISCRNLLICLESHSQREALERFRYALRPGGYLFLGPSESAPAEWFEPVAERQRIYRRVPGRATVPVPRRRDVRPGPELRDLVVEPVAAHLRTALFQAFRTGEASRRTFEVMFEGEERTVALVVHPGSGGVARLAALSFDEPPAPTGSDPKARGAAPDRSRRRLEAELRRTREQLRVEIEEREAVIETLTAANEELQAVNEEHLATTEELETRGEELSALNEAHRATIAELAEVNTYLENLIESTRIATVFLDRDLRVRRFTESVTGLFDLRPEDEGRPLHHIPHHLGREGDVLDAARRALTTGRLLEKEVESRGSWYIMRLVPYRSPETVEGVAISFIDITRRKSIERTAQRARARAEEEQARLLALMERMPAGVLIIDCPTREAPITNRRARELLADGDSAPAGDAPPRVPDVLNRIVDRLLETNEAVLDQRVRLHGGAAPRDLLVNAAAVSSRHGEVKECILTLVDIEEILAYAREFDENAERVRVGFLATISHELRTPLNAITGYAGLLLEGVPDALTQAQADHVGRIQACAEQLAGMVDQILVLTQLLEGGTRLVPAAVDPRVPLETAADLVEPEARRRGLELRRELPDEASEIVTDPERLRRILVNLAQNAVKYTLEGEVVVSLEQGRGGEVVFEVRDTGVGIAPADHERIFERFWQAHRADHRVGAQGAGIGLSVTKGLVQILQGTIEVESEVDRGSTFRIRLPAAIEGPSP